MNDYGQPDILDTITEMIKALGDKEPPDLIRLHDAIQSGDYERMFPVGTVINDFIRDVNMRIHEDPFIVVDYTRVRARDDEFKLVAVLLRKNTTPYTQEHSLADKWLNSIEPVTGQRSPNGYLHYCSSEIQALLNYSLRMYVDKAREDVALVRYEPCKFFMPSPIDLGIEVSNEVDINPETGDFHPWTYFKCGYDTTRLGFSTDGVAQPYFLRSRFNNPNCPDRIMIDQHGQLKVAKEHSCALRPACYFW